MQPYYTIMRLPGEAARRVHPDAAVHAAPEGQPGGVDGGAQRRRALRAAAVFQFPKQKLVFGPRQIVARINQDQAISPQITLWNQQGSQVIQGTLLVIPIEESLLYVRPLYLRAAGRPHPRTEARHRRVPETASSWSRRWNRRWRGSSRAGVTLAGTRDVR